MGDTLINGKTYYKVFTSGTHSVYDLFLGEIVLVEPFIGQVQFIREEQKRFLHYNSYSNDEVLFADFDLEVGDTAVSIYCQSPLIVDHIDTVYLDNEPRKRFYFEPDNSGWPYKSLIEGVGSTDGLFTNPCHEIGIEYGSSMECFSQDDGLIVIDSAAPCNTTGSIEGSPDLQHTIQLFPNPAVDYVDIFLAHYDWKNPARIRLYNLHGQLVSTYEVFGKDVMQRVDVSRLDAGVYFLNVDNGSEVWVGRIVKRR